MLSDVIGYRVACRCGWDGKGEHPCHARAYTCTNPGTARYYEPHKMYSLAGAMPKISAVQTYACDECWSAFIGKTDAKP